MQWYSAFLTGFLLFNSAVHARNDDDRTALTQDVLASSVVAGLLTTAEQVKIQVLAQIEAENILLAEFVSQHRDQSKLEPLFEKLLSLQEVIKKRIARMDELYAQLQVHEANLSELQASRQSGGAEKCAAEIRTIAGLIDGILGDLEQLVALHSEKDKAYREMYQTFLDFSHPVFEDFRRVRDLGASVADEAQRIADRFDEVRAEWASAKEYGDGWRSELEAKRGQLNSDIADCNRTIAKEFFKHDSGRQEANQLLEHWQKLLAELELLNARIEQAFDQAVAEAERLKKSAEDELDALRAEHDRYGSSSAREVFFELSKLNEPLVGEYKKLKPQYLELKERVEQEFKHSQDEAKKKIQGLVDQVLEDEVALLKASLGGDGGVPTSRARLGENRSKLRTVGVTESVYQTLADRGRTLEALDLAVKLASGEWERPVPQEDLPNILGRWFRLLEEGSSAPFVSETIETILSKTILGQVKPRGYAALAACQAFIIGFEAAGYRLVECLDNKSHKVVSYGIIKPNEDRVSAYVSPCGLLVTSRQSIVEYVAEFEFQGLNSEAPGSAELVDALARLKGYVQSLDSSQLSAEQTKRLVVALAFLDAAADSVQDLRFAESGEYRKWISLALLAVDFAIGLTPADPLVQLYGFIEGQDLITGEVLSEDEQLVRGVLVIAGVFPGGKYFVEGARLLAGKISKHGVAFLKRVRAGRFVRSPAPEKALRIAENATNVANVRWGTWTDLTRVTVDGIEYAKIGGRRYTRHAVDRMTPMGFGTAAYGTAGRGVPTMVVEYTIKKGDLVKTQTMANGAVRQTWKMDAVEVITENNKELVITVMRRGG